MTHLVLYGFGEAGQAIADGWKQPDVQVFDILLADGDLGHPLSKRADEIGVTACATPAEALSEADAVFSVVTADQAIAAASAAAPHLPEGAFWFDGNSCSPGSKKTAGEIITRAGGRYVDMAIMAPIHPRKHQTPVLLSGPHAVHALTLLQSLGMTAKVAGDEIGQASAIKMLRSVIIKGLEALTAESFLAARRAGVEEAVLASLQASDPGIDWQARGAYNLERMLVHGARRSAEMNEVAATLRELGISDRMASATAVWQAALAALDLAPGEDRLDQRADAILARMT
jgi:3-hydroxyisobutyrate dehydrogenase-like beta-hydroxyacid dehydrogenase